MTAITQPWWWTPVRAAAVGGGLVPPCDSDLDGTPHGLLGDRGPASGFVDALLPHPVRRCR